MIKAEQVPEEVWKTLRREIEGSGLRHWPEIVAAALNAWPGSYSLAGNDSAVIRDVAVIILPLLEENSDD